MYSHRIPTKRLKNCRDLGGIVNKDGLVIRERKLLRSERLADASLADLNMLHDEYEIRTIVDFRSFHEKLEVPDPVFEDVRYVDVQTSQNEEVAVQADENSLMKRRRAMDRLVRMFQRDARASINWTAEFYRSQVHEEYALKSYKSFLQEVLANEHALLYHCSYGKDRAGIATILLLEALNVDKETIKEDYLHTNMCLYGTDSYPEQKHGFYEYAHPDFLEAYYEEAEKTYGSMKELLSVLGINDRERKLLRDKYLRTEQ